MNQNDGELSPPKLTPEQRERLRRVQERLEEGDGVNPNLADTPAHAAEHGFTFKRESPFQG